MRNPSPVILAVAAAVLLSSAALNADTAAKKTEERIFCERQAGGDYRRLKICLSYMNSPPPPREQLPPGVKNPPQAKPSAPPSIKGKSAKGYAFVSNECFRLYHWRWRAGRPPKAFAIAKHKGWEVCGASYGQATITKAQSIALEECRKQTELGGQIDPRQCKLIEVK